MKIARIWDNVAKVAKDKLEECLGETFVTKENNLDYQCKKENIKNTNKAIA